MYRLPNELLKSIRASQILQEQLLNSMRPMLRSAELGASFQWILNSARAESITGLVSSHAQAIAAIESSLAPIKQALELQSQLSAPLIDQLNRLQPFADQVSVAADAARRLALVGSPIQEAMESLRTAVELRPVALLQLNKAIELSLPAVDEVNRFFYTPVIASLEDAEKGDDKGIAFEQVGEHLHISAESTIIAVNNSVSMVRAEIAALRNEVGQYSHVLGRMDALASPRQFLDVLRDFAMTFAREHWESMWAEKGSKLQRHPEQLAKAGLGMYLRGVSFGTAFVGHELTSGPGFIDLLVNLLGKNHIVELKVIAPSGQSIKWARSGIPQLEGYMESYGEDESFLVLFDGRKTTRGEQLKSSYPVAHGKVHVVRVQIYYEDS